MKIYRPKRNVLSKKRPKKLSVGGMIIAKKAYGLPLGKAKVIKPIRFTF